MNKPEIPIHRSRALLVISSRERSRRARSIIVTRPPRAPAHSDCLLCRMCLTASSIRIDTDVRRERARGVALGFMMPRRRRDGRRTRAARVSERDMPGRRCVWSGTPRRRVGRDGTGLGARRFDVARFGGVMVCGADARHGARRGFGVDARASRFYATAAAFMHRRRRLDAVSSSRSATRPSPATPSSQSSKSSSKSSARSSSSAPSRIFSPAFSRFHVASLGSRRANFCTPFSRTVVKTHSRRRTTFQRRHLLGRGRERSW